MKPHTARKKVPRRNELCPCESGRNYGKCCAEKSFTWSKGSDGVWVKNVPLHPEALKIILAQEKEFVELFGRKPSGSDPIFFENVALYSDDMMKVEMDEALAKADIPRDIAYATKKTGLIVTAHNESLLTGQDIQEWNDAIQEYYLTKGRQKKTAAEKRSAKVGELIAREFHRCMVVMGLTLREGGLLRVTDEQGVAAGHSLFCLTKTIKSMRALQLLTDKGFGEDGLVLVRSMLESYLHVAYLLKHSEKAEDLVAARIGLEIGTHFYRTNAKGNIDYSCIIEKATGRMLDGKISIKTMAAGSPYSEDLDVYLGLYEYLSGFIHPDFRCSQTYVAHESLSFDHTKQSMYMEARALGLIIGTMILHALYASEYLSEKMTKDLEHYLRRTRKKLLFLLKNGPPAWIPFLVGRVCRFPNKL